MIKTIKISQGTYDALSELASKKDTFNDVINYLINYYKENEEFTDEEADYYNEEIEKFEQEDFEKVTEITLEELEQRITLLEQEIKNDL